MELQRMGRICRDFCSDMENSWSPVQSPVLDGQTAAAGDTEGPGPIVNGGTEAAALIPMDYLAYCRLPREPGKIFEWLGTRKVPQLEDETPPASFYEVLEDADLELHTRSDGVLTISVSCQTLDGQLFDSDLEDYRPRPEPNARPPSRSRSPWTVLGSVLLAIAFMHGSYVLFRGIWRLVCQQLLRPVSDALPVEVPTQSLRGYVWSQFKYGIWAVAHVLRIV